MSPQLVPILSHFNPVRLFLPQSCKIYFNIILPFTHRPHKQSHLSRFFFLLFSHPCMLHSHPSHYARYDDSNNVWLYKTNDYTISCCLMFLRRIKRNEILCEQKGVITLLQLMTIKLNELCILQLNLRAVKASQLLNVAVRRTRSTTFLLQTSQ